MRTPLTVQLVTQPPLKGILNYVVPRVLLEEGLSLLHQLVQKLISITLHDWVDGSTFIGYEGFAEFTDV